MAYDNYCCATNRRGVTLRHFFSPSFTHELNPPSLDA